MTDSAELADPSAGDRPTEIGYAAALAELDQILVALDDPNLDVDQLGDRVARAAELVELCRDRIERARMRVVEIIADLDGDASSEEP